MFISLQIIIFEKSLAAMGPEFKLLNRQCQCRIKSAAQSHLRLFLDTHSSVQCLQWSVAEFEHHLLQAM